MKFLLAAFILMVLAVRAEALVSANQAIEKFDRVNSVVKGGSQRNSKTEGAIPAGAGYGLGDDTAYSPEISDGGGSMELRSVKPSESKTNK